MVSSVPLLFFAMYCDFFFGGGWLCCEVAIFLMLRCLVGLNIRRFCDVAIAGCPVEAGICVARHTQGRSTELTALQRICRPPPRFYWQVAMLLRSVGKLRFLIFVGRLVFVGKLCLDGWEAWIGVGGESEGKRKNPGGLGWGLVATTAGLEPVTSAVTGRRSNQLSYAAVVSVLRLTTDRNTTAKSQLCKTAACHGVLGVARRGFAGKETNLSRSASRCRRRCGAPGWPAMRPKRTSQCPRHCTWRASPSPR